MTIREHFEHDLQAVRQEIMELGSAVSTAVNSALSVLAQRDVDAAQQLIRGDAAINEAAQYIETQAFKLIATQQPVATDLRQLIGAIEMSGELERIGDYAKGIATVVLRFTEHLPADLPPSLNALSAQAIWMLDSALAAYAAGDVATAKALQSADDIADSQYASTTEAVTSPGPENPVDNRGEAGLVLVAYYLERVADRSTNLAEHVVFIVRGETVTLNS